MPRNLDPVVSDLIDFLKRSPTAWHAVEALHQRFSKEGFKVLREEEEWNLKPGGKYVVERNGSSLCAFSLPVKKPEGMDIAASHTDSPGFKLKPNPEFRKENMVMVGVEVYGAPLLSSWLNRDLGVAGRIVYLDKKGEVKESLVNCSDMPVVIPQLAIHLDRQVNEAGLILNKQEHLSALAGCASSEDKTYLEILLGAKISTGTLLGSDLFLYPLEPPALLGMQKEMLASYRIDSLASVHAIMQGMLHGGSPLHKNRIKMAIFWDNEEIGSETAHGAGSPFLLQVVERLTLALGLSREEFLRLMHKSQCVSVDLAHALHPNHAERHDPRHQIKLGGGIVVKFNAQQRYATDARSCAKIAHLCLQADLPFQKFACRNDIPCGSTIGPIQAALSGISTVDIGIPQLSMHSSREIIAWQDHLDMCRLLAAYFH